MMSATHTTRANTLHRSRVFGVLLLAFVYIAQPALAFVAAGSEAAPCRTQGEDCCCVTELEVPTKSCCGSEESEHSESEESSACDCRVGSGEIPAQDPSLPLDRESTLGGSLLAKWIQTQAESGASVECGLPYALFTPSVRDGTGGHEPPGSRTDFVRPMSSVGAWTLLTRGMASFLAVLAVARA